MNPLQNHIFSNFSLFLSPFPTHTSLRFTPIHQRSPIKDLVTDFLISNILYAYYVASPFILKELFPILLLTSGRHLLLLALITLLSSWNLLTFSRLPLANFSISLTLFFYFSLTMTFAFGYLTLSSNFWKVLLRTVLLVSLYNPPRGHCVGLSAYHWARHLCLPFVTIYRRWTKQK